MNGDLRLEFQYLHRSLYGTLPKDNGLADKYVEAIINLGFNADCFAKQQEWIHRLIQNESDLVAGEYFLRLRGRNHLLTKKFHALLYLTESTPDYADAFYKKHSTSKLSTILKLSFLVVKSAIKLLKGYFIHLRHPCLM